MKIVTSEKDSWSIMYDDVVTTKSRTMPLYIGHSFDIFTIDESNLELDPLSAMNGYGIAIVVSSLLAAVVVGSYCKYPLYQYMYDTSKELTSKPVDLLILIQAIIEHLVCIGMVVFFSVGLIFDITFASYFGEMWCLFPWYAASFSVAYRTIGSLGIAILRLIHIKKAIQAEGVGAGTKWIVLFVCIVVTALVCIGYMMGDGSASRKQVLWNFCTGTSEAVRESVFNYSLARGIIDDGSDLISKVSLSIPAFGVLAEFGCYILFFHHIYSHNERLVTKKVLPVVEVRKRHRKNAITFLGQFYCFLVECCITIGFIYTMHDSSGPKDRAFLIIGLWCEFGILSVIEVITSNTLKENLLHKRLLKRN